MFNLKQKDAQFFQLFSKGAEISANASKELKLLMNELTEPEKRLQSITNLENSGDDVTHCLLELTKKMFITPIDREDIFNITKEIDNVTDNIDAAAYRFYMYNITNPTREALEIVDKLQLATEALVVIIAELKTLNKSQLMIDKIIEMNEIEKEADDIYRRALKNLFKNPEDLLSVIIWKDIYKYLEDSIDSCEKLATEIRGVAMKYA